MRWSFRIGVVAGTEVRVHVTFFLLLAGFGWMYFAEGGVAAALDGVLFILAVFTCVLLHEFGHVLMAKQFGVRTPDITLLPIGGLARLERMPEKPWQELLVAVAGPAVNVVIAVFLFVVVGFPILTEEPGAVLHIPFFQRLLLVNIGLVIFNMIPAFPMDGGRVFRSLLAMVVDYGKATEVAAALGQLIAFTGGIFAIWNGNPVLVLIAIFIFMAARAEARMVRARQIISGISLQDVMVTEFPVLRVGDALGDAVTAMINGAQQDFPVLNSAGELEGLLTRPMLMQAAAGMGEATRVEDVMLRDVPTVPLHFPLQDAVQVLRTSPVASLPVVDESQRRVRGLLNADNVAEVILARSRGRGRSVATAEG